MWSNCSDHAAFRKSSSSKTSHCRTINSTSPTIPQRFGQHCSSLDTETIKIEVLFTDESRFNVEFADGRLRVRKRRNKQFDQEKNVQSDRYSGGCVMVWGGISLIT